MANWKGTKWRDLWSLNNWVVRDYYRLVDSVNALETYIQRLSDEQVKCNLAILKKLDVKDGWIVKKKKQKQNLNPSFIEFFVASM